MHNYLYHANGIKKLTEVESDTWLSIAKYSKFICISNPNGNKSMSTNKFTTNNGKQENNTTS